MVWHPLPFAASLLPLLVAMVLLWLASLPLRNASIVDIFWGPLFLVPVATAMWQAPELAPRDILLASLVGIWALRLGLHIAVRNAGHGEDARYRHWREEAGASWWWQSLFQVFVLQGLLVWIVAAPLVASVITTAPGGWSWWDALGAALWLIGFLFEAVGDWQLRRFKSRPENAGKVMDRGLWSLTRHPNYFGDALLWWGYYCLAVGAGAPELVFSPLLMTWLLRRVSGVTLLEQDLAASKPGYADYIRRVPAFFPRLRAGRSSAD